MFNDLIGLKQSWHGRAGDGSGAINCCLLMAEARRRLGYHDFTEEFHQIVKAYTPSSLPLLLIPRWLLQNGTRLQDPEPHAVALLPGQTMEALGTVMDDGRVLFISQENGVVIAPLHSGAGHFFRLHK